MIPSESFKRKDLKNKTSKYIYDFQQFKTIRYVGNNIFTGKIKIDEAEKDQSSLLENIIEFNDKSRTRSKEGQEKKEILMKA